MRKLYNEWNTKLFSGRKIPVMLHVAVWLILFILPAYLLFIDSGNDESILRRTYIQIFLYAVIFYANYLVFTPKLFFKHRKLLYFVAAISLVVIATIVNELAFKAYGFRGRDANREMGKYLRLQPPPGVPFMPRNEFVAEPQRPSANWPLYNFIITTLFLSGFGLGLSFTDKFTEQEKKRKEAEKEKLNSELAFLKNQINPHFLFNTLNNIYSLVQTSVPDGQKAILQLSKLMRYILYETEKGDRFLSQEIDFMKTYIELMKLRISDKVSITVSFPEDFTDVAIPPLLFLPFVENAFKHGISYRRPSFVNVQLKTEPEKIIFECSNSIGNTGDELMKSDSGIGLENVKKRLALLYPDRHNLQVLETDTTYQIILQIDIS
ncbi:MAG: histidine kinase [Bacteroidales bacterium]|nr:histidine kinase [Bacteroidales bacterium]